MPRLVSKGGQQLANVAYALNDRLYLNITNRCTLRCKFCPKFNGTWAVRGYELRLSQEPTAAEVMTAIGESDGYEEMVFCGLGEPTQRLDVLLAVAKQLKGRRARVRLNTDGLANLLHARDITPELRGWIDTVSISLNAQDEVTYLRHTRPTRPGAFAAMLDFARAASSQGLEVVLTALDGLPGVDIDECQRLANQLGLGFRRRVLGVVG